jgi:hypothetical protein
MNLEQLLERVRVALVKESEYYTVNDRERLANAVETHEIWIVEMEAAFAIQLEEWTQPGKRMTASRKLEIAAHQLVVADHRAKLQLAKEEQAAYVPRQPRRVEEWLEAAVKQLEGENE